MGLGACALSIFTARNRQGLFDRWCARSPQVISLLAGVALGCSTITARADEDGISFWIPGFFGSLAATPQQPGWSLASIFYNTNVSASGNAALARAITIGQFNPNVDVNVNAHVRANFSSAMVAPTYVFATPFLGGQASVSLLGLYGGNDSALNTTFNSQVGSRTINLEQTTWGLGDLIPMFTVRWNAGVNNYMTYLTGDIPVGLYSHTNLANIGLGHGALDGGVGYTYLNQQTGHEFSVVTGFTGNFTNPETNYTSGIDWHLDWGASQFLSKQVLVGLVGYFYEQLTPDKGCAPVLCPFESRVIGVGPQIGYIFPAGHDMEGYINLKAYGEFANANRPDGFNVWLTFSLSPAPAAAEAAEKRIVTK
jgi:hypothetical protein